MVVKKLIQVILVGVSCTVPRCGVEGSQTEDGTCSTQESRSYDPE